VRAGRIFPSGATLLASGCSWYSKRSGGNMRAPQQSARIANHHTIEKLVRGEMVKRKTHEHVLKAIRAYKPDTP